MMDARTLEALKGSIRHWEQVATDLTQPTGPMSCALCHLFYFDGNRCVGCPVFEKTGAPTCRSSPYETFIGNPTVENAQAELRFLKSLLPNPHNPEGERGE